MPEFYYRIARQQTLIDSNDYRITAATSEEALAKLEAAQNLAQATDRTHETTELNLVILASERGKPAVWADMGTGVLVLDPHEVVECSDLITQLDAATGMPTETAPA